MGVIKDIRTMKIQGAIEITLASLKYLKNYGRKHGYKTKFKQKMGELESVRDTEVVLHNVLEQLEKEPGEERLNELMRCVEGIDDKVGEVGKKLIRPGFQVHTHCHSSEVMRVIKKSAEKGKITVVINETRPMYQGLISARELSKVSNIHVILVVDNVMGMAVRGELMQKDDVIVVGCDSIREKGFVNKIGTYMLGLCAMEHDVPFYVVGSKWKCDNRKKINIEERKPEEVHKKMKNVDIRNPAFEIIPWKYVTGVVVEDRVKKPKKIIKEIKK